MIGIITYVSLNFKVSWIPRRVYPKLILRLDISGSEWRVF